MKMPDTRRGFIAKKKEMYEDAPGWLLPYQRQFLERMKCDPDFRQRMETARRQSDEEEREGERTPHET